MADLDLDAIKAKHGSTYMIEDHPDGPFTLCAECDEDWPCDVARLVAEVEHLRGQVGAVRAPCEHEAQGHFGHQWVTTRQVLDALEGATMPDLEEPKAERARIIQHLRDVEQDRYGRSREAEALREATDAIQAEWQGPTSEDICRLLRERADRIERGDDA